MYYIYNFQYQSVAWNYVSQWWCWMNGGQQHSTFITKTIAILAINLRSIQSKFTHSLFANSFHKEDKIVFRAKWQQFLYVFLWKVSIFSYETTTEISFIWLFELCRKLKWLQNPTLVLILIATLLQWIAMEIIELQSMEWLNLVNLIHSFYSTLSEKLSTSVKQLTRNDCVG